MALELDMINGTKEYSLRKRKMPVAKIQFSDNTPPTSVNICIFFHFSEEQRPLYKGHRDTLNVLRFIPVSILYKEFKILPPSS